jgi:hypothetical protein
MRGRTDWVAGGGAATALLVACAVTLLAPAGGCGRGRVKPAIASRDPSEKIPGIVAAVSAGSLEQARHMIASLSSDDPAIRLFAISGLRRLTGLTLEYNYYEDEEDREPAVKRWEQWLAQQEATN